MSGVFGELPRVRWFARVGRRRTRTVRRRRAVHVEPLEPRRVLAGNLIGHWLADDLNVEAQDGAVVTTWRDSTSGIEAVAAGEPRLVKDRWLDRSVVRFDPSDGDDQFRVAASANPMSGAEDFTVVVVFATSAAGAGDAGQWWQNSGIVDGNEPGDTGDWGLGINRQGQVGAGIGRSERTVYSNESGLNDGQLHVVTYTRRASTPAIYIDGGAAQRLRNGDSFPRNHADMTFGSLQTNENYFSGDIAEIRVYDDDLTKTEVETLYAELNAFYTNHPPAASDDAFEVREDGTLILGAGAGVLANDTDVEGDSLHVVLVEDAEHGSLSLIDNGSLVYVPEPNFFGTDRFTYRAQDLQDSNVATATIEVVAGNTDPAQAVADHYVLSPGEDRSVDASAGLLANDVNPERTNLATVLVEDVAEGSLTLREDGSFTYRPGAFVGTTQFRYLVRDPLGDQNTATVTLVVNAAPAARDDAYELTEDTPFTADGASGVLANDSDAESDPLTAILVEDARHGRLDLMPDGSFTFEPDDEYSGSDRFTYVVDDGDQHSETVTAQLNVNPVNDRPTAVDDVYFASAARPLSVPEGGGVLDNDTDVDSPALSAVVMLPPAHGQLQLSPDGSFTYAPEPSFIGVDTFVYKTTDGASDSVPAAVSIVVSRLDQPIVINEIHYNTADNTLRAEFIELFNASASPVDVSGWFFSDGVNYTIPQGTVIGPKAYLVIAEDPATMEAEFGVAALGPWTGRLSNDGEPVVLRNAGNDRVDAVDYRVGYPWPVASGGEGSSMELILPSLDNDLGGSWRAEGLPTPGAENTVFSTSAPPQSRQVDHRPETPTSGEDTVITIKVTDPDGVDRVELQYQVVLPGQFIPAWLPAPIDELKRARDELPEMTPNPEYHDPANWTAMQMVDDGSGADAVAGDGVYTAVVPGQIHRSLVRYRMTVQDRLGASVMVPYPDDMSLNFAYFVYDGVPEYNGHSAETLESLPVYHFLTRSEDMEQVLAYDARDQMTQGSLAWWAYNWSGAMVYDGQVYDNITYRLRGANGRYHVRGKRNMKFRFNNGHYFQARDQDGNPYPEEWRFLTAGKGFDNRQTLTYGLNEAASYFLFSQMGIPTAKTHWFHFRVIDDAAEAPDPWHGDFWGLGLALETYDVRFMNARDMPKGNMYKLINSRSRALDQQRYQAPGAVTDGSDHDNIEQNLDGSDSAEYIRNHVNLDLYYRYLAVVEAVRHYDYWPSANKNMVYYFEPDYRPENSNLGKLTILPWDTDATWGPTWNMGHDVVYNSIFPSTATGGDPDSTPELWPEYFNVLREVRDLLWQPDQIEPLVDHFAAQIADFVPADRDRWFDVPSSARATAGSYSGLSGKGMQGLDALVEDMKNFAFVGGSWPGGTVGAGGRAAYLDGVLRAPDRDVPQQPTIRYVGGATMRAEDLRFETSAFTDPQGDAFGAIQWRIAKVSDPSAPKYDPKDLFLEWNTAWETESNTFDPRVTIPADAIEVGHAYRVRVKMMDDTGQWSHWSEPFQFVAPTPQDSVFDSLRISEINYHPLDAAPQMGELDVDKNEFEFVELVNIGTQPVDLAGVKFLQVIVEGATQGIEFSFPSRTLDAGERILVVRNQQAFASRYGAGMNIAGQYSGRLRNGGELLTLVGPGDQIIQQFRYDDQGAWPGRADGGGSSLEVIDVRAQASDPENWRPSSEVGGSPGTEGAGKNTGVIVNEILANTDPAQRDMIELYNTTPRDLDITNWYLANDGDDLLRYPITTPTTIPALGYQSVNLAELGLDLDGYRGDHIWLTEADEQGRPRRFVLQTEFGGAPVDVSLGRWPDVTGPFLATKETTMAAPNSGPRIGEVVISEVNYNPADPDGPDRLRANDFEYVELFNRTDASMDLTDWRFTGTLDYPFDPGTTIGPGKTLLLVGFSPDNATKSSVFRFLQGVPPDVQLVGPYDEPLDDERGSLRLEQRGQSPPDDPTFVPYYVVDAVDYDSVPPWPAGAGASLTRTDPTAFGLLPVSWSARPPSPGSIDFVMRHPGDANDDGQFDQRDISLVLQGGKFRTGQPAAWSEGDWNGDGLFDHLDLVVALQSGGYLQGPLAAFRPLAHNQYATAPMSDLADVLAPSDGTPLEEADLDAVDDWYATLTAGDT